MGGPRPTGYPADRAAGRWVFDVLVTLAAAVSAVPVVVHDNARPQLAAIMVLALGAAPLLARRVWPFPVFGVVLAVNFAAGIAGHAHALNGAALLIALYTVAAMRPRRDALVCTALLELPVVAGLLVFAGDTWWYDAIFVSGLLAAALGLGLYSATRRAYLAEAAGVQLTVYRLVQEALTNTLKHGGMRARASVRLQFQPGELRVDVDDDGAGATAPATASIGSGLIGMQERARAYGGDVQAGPRQPGGWKVSAKLHPDGDAA